MGLIYILELENFIPNQQKTQAKIVELFNNKQAEMIIKLHELAKSEIKEDISHFKLDGLIKKLQFRLNGLVYAILKEKKS